MWDWFREFVIVGSIDVAHDLTHHVPYYGLAALGAWFCLGCVKKWLRHKGAPK